MPELPDSAEPESKGMRVIGSQRAAERLAVSSDGELAHLASEGDSKAFGELYRRHAPTAWRVANAVTGNPDDAADAVSDAFARVLQALPAGRLEEGQLFRPYLLTATRNAAIDLIRRGGRSVPTDRLEHLDHAGGATPSDRLVDGEDSSLAAAAFRSLPERWRTVLWLTEVEGMAPSEVAPLLGVTANTAAQLAVRARAGLRERFLQLHLTTDVDADCKFTTSRLGAYVAGRLAPRDLAKVDQHLAGCEPCRERKEELEDVGSTLRGAVLPLPLLLGSATLAHWKTLAHTGRVAAGSGVRSLKSWTGKAQKPLLAASTGLFALGVISASVVGAPSRPRPGLARGSVPTRPTTPPVVVEQLASSSGPLPGFGGNGTGLASTDTTVSAPVDDAGATLATSPVAANPPAGQGSGPSSSVNPPASTTDPAPIPLANAGIAVDLNGLQAGVSGGYGDGSCSGIDAAGTVEGCAPPTTDAGTVGVSVTTDGSAVGPLAGQNITAGI